jgi:hypothetical protein
MLDGYTIAVPANCFYSVEVLNSSVAASDFLIYGETSDALHVASFSIKDKTIALGESVTADLQGLSRFVVTRFDGEKLFGFIQQVRNDRLDNSELVTYDLIERRFQRIPLNGWDDKLALTWVSFLD